MEDGKIVVNTYGEYILNGLKYVVAPLGQLPFFIEYLKLGGLFDSLVENCMLHYASPNSPNT